MFDFQKEVIERSYEKPVVVDFWAPWCGPCRILTPVLEQIVEEQADQWELVKLNTEDHDALANEYKIRSIPNVKMFYRGEVIHEFMGALPRAMVLDWLKKALPGGGLRALDRLLSSKDQPDVSELEELMNTYPDSPEIRIVYSQLLLWEDPAKALQLLEPIKLGSPLFDKANFLRDIAAFLVMDTSDAELMKIKKLLLNAHLDEAIPLMIQVLGKNNKAGDGKVGKAAIGIFNTLGAQHPLSKTYRKQLDMVLWV